MAAAEYYNPGNAQQRPPPAPVPAPAPHLQPPPQNQPPPNYHNQTPYPMADGPPPPYSPGQHQRPHSQPPPQQHGPAFQSYQQNGSNAGRPNAETHQYPPEKMPQQPQRPGAQNMYRPADYASSHPPPPPPQQNGYPPQQPNIYAAPIAPGLSQVYTDQSHRPPRRSSTSPYRRSSRSRSRDKKKHHHRPQVQRQKSSGVNTFLGAGGGAIIGDLIFPGMGTLGGAILGGLGGHEYSKKRTQSNPSRTANKRSESYSNSRGHDYYDDSRGRKWKD